ncbi:hypothetical protein, partial [Macrococcus hajekii]
GTTENPTSETTSESSTSETTPIVEPTTETVDATIADLNTKTTTEEKQQVLTDYLVDNTGVTQEEAAANLETMNLDYDTLTSDELVAA